MFKARKEQNKIYAGRRKINNVTGEVPKLFDICLKFCNNNINGIV